MSGFKDHFSTASDRYAAYRPDYPAALYDWLAGQCREQETAWGGAAACVAAVPARRPPARYLPLKVLPTRLFTSACGAWHCVQL